MTIGLTGGIGSGKSTVAKLFELLGSAVFKSDEVAKELYYEKKIKEKVIDLLGTEVYTSEFSINRSLIGKLIFQNPALLQQLNDIIHPEVNRRFQKFVLQHPNDLVMIESALLFEAKINTQVDKVITVVSPDELRIERVMNRDGLTRDEVISKMNAQMSQEEKMKLSDMIILNNEKDFLITQVLAIFNQLNKHA